MGLFSGTDKAAASQETKKYHAAYAPLLADGEIIEVGFVVFRDTYLFTNKRLIVVEVTGISGKQLEYVSIPYAKINKFSVRAGGSFDLDAELKLWLGSEAIPFEKKFNQEVNVYEVQKVLASHVLR